MQTHTLLWTSGWDSTFRLLQIVLIKKETVQPIYIIDNCRKSLKNEVTAIDNIVHKIITKYPNSKELIKPIWYLEKEKIDINKEISTAFSELTSIRKIGSQYEWLAQFCYNYDLKNVEICIEKNLELSSFAHYLKNNYLDVNPFDVETKKVYEAINTVFKYFHFPVIDLLKTDMLAITKENQWEEIMNLTWFCHKPNKNKPCGKCNPCKDVIKKGLGFRIPLKNRIIGYYKIIRKNGLNW